MTSEVDIKSDEADSSIYWSSCLYRNLISDVNETELREEVEDEGGID